MKTGSAVLIAALTFAAGCLGIGDEVDLEEVEGAVHQAAYPFLVNDHGTAAGHHAADAHGGSYNLERVGYHNGIDDSGDPDAIIPAGYYTELAVRHPFVYLVRNSESGTFGGFSILDVSDPAAIRLVSAYQAPGGGDIEISADEEFAFYATQRTNVENLTASIPAIGSNAALTRGIHVVDIADKRLPQLAAFVALPYNGPHTLTYHEHEDGNEYVIAATYDMTSSISPSSALPALPGGSTTIPLTQRVIVYQFERSPPSLLPVSTYRLAVPGPAGMEQRPHDTYVERDGDETRLYVSYWDAGLRILDFNDPMQPTEIGSFTDFGPSSENAIHFARPMNGPVGGRHITVAEPEIVQADETGQITFLDTSLPDRPEKLGWWTLPHGPIGPLFVTDLDFSPHNFDVFDGKIALAHNHGGLWVIDASTPQRLGAPKSVAFTMETFEREDTVRMQPFFWSVFESEGLLYASDEATGLYVLRYTGP